MPNTFAQIADEIHGLDAESKRELAALIKSWLIEEHRGEIVESAEQSENEYQAGQTKSGNVDELMADLHAED